MSVFRTRTGGMAGIVGAVVLLVAGLLTGSPPSPSDSTKEVVSFLVDKRDALRWQFVLFAVAMILVLWFTAAFGALMARGEGVSSVHAAFPLVAVGGILAIAFAGTAPLAAVVWRGAETVDPRIAQLTWDINSVATAFVGVPAVVVFLIAGALVLRSRMLPTWVGWLALAAAALNVFGIIAIVFDADNDALAPGGALAGIVGLVAAAVWIAATSVAMLQADRA